MSLTLTLTVTDQVAEVEGQRVRLLRGTTPGGVAVVVYAMALLPAEGADDAAFRREILAGAEQRQFRLVEVFWPGKEAGPV